MAFCGTHGLAIANDGRCVICRRSEPPPPPPRRGVELGALPLRGILAALVLADIPLALYVLPKGTTTSWFGLWLTGFVAYALVTRKSWAAYLASARFGLSLWILLAFRTELLESMARTGVNLCTTWAIAGFVVAVLTIVFGRRDA